jgi:hypothetical protein
MDIGTAASVLRDLDRLLETASRNIGNPRGEIAEALLQEFVAELFPAMGRICEVLNDLEKAAAPDEPKPPAQAASPTKIDMPLVVPMQEGRGKAKRGNSNLVFAEG